jgi:GAF domain-containing protein
MTDPEHKIAHASPEEELRQAAIFAAGVLGMGDNPVLRAIVSRAADQLKVPIVAVSIVDRGRQLFPACVGIDITETPRGISFCAHAIQEPGNIMCVPDAAQDPRFADNILVTGSPGIRFYASAPLVTKSGAALGTLCIIDRSPREPLTEDEQAILRSFAEEVLAEMERPENMRFFSARAIELIVAQIGQAAAADDEPLMLALDRVLRSVERTIADTHGMGRQA